MRGETTMVRRGNKACRPIHAWGWGSGAPFGCRKPRVFGGRHPRWCRPAGHAKQQNNFVDNAYSSAGTAREVSKVFVLGSIRIRIASTDCRMVQGGFSVKQGAAVTTPPPCAILVESRGSSRRVTACSTLELLIHYDGSSIYLAVSTSPGKNES